MYYDSYTYTKILEEMKASVPPGIDKTEGNYLHDSTAPVALKLEEAYVEMDKILMFFFLQDVFGDDIDKKGTEHGVPRKKASNAVGLATVTAQPGIYIPKGKMFNRIYKNELLQFVFVDKDDSEIELSIPESETVEARIKCVNPGSVGNIPEGEFDIDTLGVRIINKSPLTAGVDGEADALYIERIYDRVQNPPSSGNKRDYERWAKEVPGVGYAKCISQWNGRGTVKVIIADYNGMPVDDEIVKRTSDYIDPVPEMGEGQAPVGAAVTVVSIGSFFIEITITSLEIDNSIGIHEVKQNIHSAIHTFVQNISIGGVIKKQFLEATIVQVAGVRDFVTTKINGSEANITMTYEQKAILGEIVYD